MKTIKVSTIYLHQGHKLSPKLAYGVPDAVANGMVRLGLAQHVSEPADLTLDGLTWDADTKRADKVQPDDLTHEQLHN